MSEPYKDWIVRFYASHNDIPEGHSDGGIVGELIRCKDCKYYEETDETIGTCLLTVSGAHIKGYCAWAERKDNG